MIKIILFINKYLKLNNILECNIIILDSEYSEKCVFLLSCVFFFLFNKDISTRYAPIISFRGSFW